MKASQNGFFWTATILILTVTALAGGDSLWSPAFEGYLTARTSVQEGDIVLIRVDASSSLSFEASTSDAKNITLEFSGGEFGNLFSFLPSTRTGGNLSTKGKQSFGLETEVAGRITQIDAAGKALVEGSRSFSLENKEEFLSIRGWIDPAALGPDRKVSFSQLADARLSFRTFLEPAGTTLTAADIEEVVEIVQTAALAVTAPTAVPGPAAPPTAAPPTAAAAAAPPTAAPQERRSYRISDEKKMELFLIYINRLVDLLFQ